MNARQLSLSAVAAALLAAGSGTALAQSNVDVPGPEAVPIAPSTAASSPGPIMPAPVIEGVPVAPAAGTAPHTYPMPVYTLPAYPGGPVYPVQAYPSAPVYSGTSAYPYPAPAYPGGPIPAGVPPYASPYGTTSYAAGGINPADYDRARADWISECADRYRHDKRDGKGGLIGGLLGALIGGFAGNRIDDKGDRWAGTLIGAGVGGVAGAVVGTLANRTSSSRKSKLDNEALDWCEDYLTRHSSPAYAQPYGYGSYGPVMMVPVMVPKARKHTEQVIEEVVEPAPVIRRTIPHRAPDKRVKLTPIK
jgi:hypothetical protein